MPLLTIIPAPPSLTLILPVLMPVAPVSTRRPVAPAPVKVISPELVSVARLRAM
ncbi:hypothetical protein [Rahnella inusitata]|uniref:hypothetical protein n=1 Tax=Rahnella inusitata TaxID=58169 RepID=UPI001FC9E023|nr:hypothetical protein [Rahnella inusitata]